MTQQHPITPPPDLVQHWVDTYFGGKISQSNFHVDLATRAALWGSDQELEACCEWFQEFYKAESWGKRDLERFRTARRPKPPSLKKEAMDTLHLIRDHLPADMYEKSFLIRRALEQLDD